MIIFAGSMYNSGVAGLANEPVRTQGNILYSTVCEKRHSNTNSNSTFGVLWGYVHEFGHNLGFHHIPSNSYDPMCPYYSFSFKKLNYCPVHFNPLYKLKAGWLTTGDFNKYTSGGTKSLTSSAFTPSFGIVTLYGDALRNDDIEHSEYYVLEYRKREGFNQFVGGENDTNFSGGILIWQYSPYRKFTMRNNERNPIGLKVVSPDNYDANDGGHTYDFYYPGGNTSLSPGTTPSTYSREDQSTEITINNFSYSGSNQMSFSLSQPSPVLYTSVITDKNKGTSTTIAGNVYLSVQYLDQLTVQNGSIVDVAPGSEVEVTRLVTNSTSPGGVIFQGVGPLQNKAKYKSITCKSSVNQSRIQNCIIKDATDGLLVEVNNSGSFIAPIVTNNQFQNCNTDMYLYNNGYDNGILYAELSDYTDNVFGKLKLSGYWTYTDPVNNLIIPTDGYLSIVPQQNLFYENNQVPEINPNNVLKFAKNKSLICYGKLIANGTSTQKIIFSATSGERFNKWGNIKLHGTGASGSIINNVIINYGNGLQLIDVPSFTVSNCSFKNNYLSIYVSGSDGIIKDNYLESNSTWNLIQINSANVTINRNEITKTNEDPYYGIGTGSGIIFTNGSTGKIFQNQVSNCNWGIAAVWGSSPTTRKSSYAYLEKNNKVIHCNIGLQVYRSSFPNFGEPSSYLYKDNSIYGNNKDAIVGSTTYINYPSSLKAMSNWWGTPTPSASQFYVVSPSTLYRDYPLTSDPWGGFSKSSGNSYMSANNFNDEITGSIEVDKESLTYSAELRYRDRYKEAMDFTLSYLKDHPDDQAAYVELYNCYSKETAKEIIKYFKKLPQKASDNHKLLLAYLYLKEGKISAAKKINDNVISTHRNSVLSTRAKLNNLYISLYKEGDISKAKNIYNDVLAKKELTNDMELQDAEYAMESYIRLHKKSDPYLAKLQQELYGATSDEEEELLPDEYDLMPNYPNPFNPTTTIKYSLPYNSSVQLVVYDIMGREVRSFELNSQSPGTHSIVWDGRNANGVPVSSGVYFYRIHLESLENSQEFEKTAKMIMLK